jgi:hypothetical protein
MDREERCGQVRSGRHGVARWICFGGTAVVDRLDLASHHKAGTVWRGSVCMARQSRHVTTASVGARQVSHGFNRRLPERHGRNGTQRLDPPLQVGSASLGLEWLGRQRTATLPTARHRRQCEDGGSWTCSAGTIRHGTPGTSRQARRGQTYKVWSGLARSRRSGTARPAIACPARSRWPRKGSKSRQARADRFVERVIASHGRHSAIAKRQHNGALRAPFHPQENQWLTSFSETTRSALS